MVNRQTIRRKIFHLVLSGVLLFSLGAVALLPQPVSAMPIEKALSFDGIDDYVDCGGGASLDITEAITIEAWVKTTDNSGYQVIVDKRIGAAELNYLVRLNNGYLKFTFYNGGYRDLQDDTTQLANNTFYYLAVTYDRANIRLYVNGVEVKSVGETDAMIPDTSPLTIGRQTYSNSSHFNGLIDEVRISNVARTPAEITANWNGGVGERFVMDGNTAALWHMNEGSGGTISDETANNNDGTIYGATWVDGFPFPSEAPAGISQVVFTTPERTVLVNEAAEMTIQTQDAANIPTPVTGATTINLSSTSFGGEFLDVSLAPTSSVVISEGTSSATFYYRDTAIGTPTITAAEDPEATWTDASQGVTVQGPVELWREVVGLVGTYLTIQEAIDNASDGDDIIVLPGTYNEQIVIYKQVTVKSSDGADSTIIDAQEGTDVVWEAGEDAATFYPAVWIQRDGVEFGDLDHGFTIRNTFPMVFPEGAEEPSGSGVAILPNAPGCTIRGNTIEDSNPVGIFADIDMTIISQNTVSAILGIYSGGGGGSITGNTVDSAYYGIIIETGQEGNNVSNNTVSNSWGCAIYVENDGALITNNDLLDSQGTAIMLQDTSNAEVSGNTITTDTTSVAGTYGIDVQGGNNNTISDNDISYVLVGGITLNNTSENNLSGNEIYDIDGYDLSDTYSGKAEWTREQVEFDRFSVKMETGEDPEGEARFEMPMSFPLLEFGMGSELGGGGLGGGELYFWAYLADEYGYGSRDYWLDNEALLPTYQLELDTDGDGIADVTLSANTGCEELVANEWLKLFAVGDWNKLGTDEFEPLSEWINIFPGANIVRLSVIYAGAPNKTMYIDGSMQEGMPMEPPQGIAIGRSDRNSVSGNVIYGINGAGILIVESNQNMIGEYNFIVENGIGIFIENSNENNVRGNLIAANYQEGILIMHSYNNQIIGNDIEWNRGGMSGIHLDGESDGNEIHANNIVDNTPRDGAGNIIRDEDGNITSFGVVKDGGWVNATGNWWGDDSGPYHWRNPGGTGDAVSDFVHFGPWATTPLPEDPGIAPTIVDNLAMPRMTALLGMFMGEVGPEWTSLVVEAYDNEGGVGIAQVTVDLGALLEQMLPGVVIPSEKQEEWDNWLSELARSHLECQGNGVYQGDFKLEELLYPLTGYLGEDDVQRIMCQLTLGDFSIPVTLVDWCGNGKNEVSGYIDLTIVDIMQPLKEGWNLISTPVTLEDEYAAWVNLVALGDGLRFDDALRYDPALGEFGEWVGLDVPPDYKLKPLEAIYVHATGNDQIGIIFNRGLTPPPSLYLEDGWNLVGLAIPPDKWDSMPVNRAMVTVEDVSGYRGYSVVVSPDQRVDYNEEYRYWDTEGGEYHFYGYGWNFEQSPWVYTIGSYNIPAMRVGGGYWVFMEEADMLAGFSSTPVTFIHQEEPEPEPEPGEPQYGGQLTVCTGYGEAPTADMTESMWPTACYAAPVLDYLITGDIDQYGPRGTNEFAFRIPMFVPEEFCRGNLVESWEVAPDKIVFHIRPGIYWAAMGKEHVMDPREYTADDTAFSLTRYMESPAGQAMLAPYDWIKSIYAVDKYTCVVETNFFNANWKWLISTGWGNAQYAPEVVAAGASDWNNLVGTGPFMLKEYIPGSHFIYERNPDYWDTTTINGKEYQIPFVDELVYPIMPDESTRMAALRTGKLDYMTGVSLQYEDSLARACPDLIQEKVTSPEVRLIGLRCDNQPFNDIRVRRALMIATNREAIAKALFIEAEMYSWPISPQLPNVYTPFNELPESIQELFEYNPEMAKALLAEAGYPEGFKLSFLLGGGDPIGMDMASMVKDMWAEIGVEVELNVMEAAAYFELITTHEGYDVMTTTHVNTNPLATLRNEFLPGERRNFANYDNPYFTEQYQEAVQTMNSAERNATLRELAVIGLDDVPYIPIGAPLQLICSWPWLKNYYGEFEESAWGTAHINARIWIDKNLKAAMGF